MTQNLSLLGVVTLTLTLTVSRRLLKIVLLHHGETKFSKMRSKTI